MSDRMDEVLRRLGVIESNTKLSKPKWYERIFWAIEKAFIPLTIAVLAYVGNLAASKISEGQLALAKSNSENRKAEFDRTMQSKYLELFYRDITSTDVKQQANAMSLLKLMDPALAGDVAVFVQANPQVSAALKAEVRAESQRIEASAQLPTLAKGKGVLAGYKIGIYYLASDPAATTTARAVQAHLKKQGIDNLIALYPSTSESMENMNPPSDLEVRFEEGIENRQAVAIRDALSKPPFARSTVQVPVGTTTPNFVSIFVPYGG